MPKTQPDGELSTSRPVEGPTPLTGVRSRAVRRARGCLHLAAPIDETVRRRSRIQDALAAGELTFRSERDGLTHTIAVFGELDLATRGGVEAELIAVEATDVQLIILDLSGLTFMDSSGVHLIAAADARCSAAAKQLRLLRGPPQIQRVFTLAAADTLPFAA